MSDLNANELRLRLDELKKSDELEFIDIDEFQEDFFDICEGNEFLKVRSELSANILSIAPPWLIGMSDEFVKDVRKFDKKLQGRVLEAITEIADSKIESRGDTLKPLTGELKGCWRFRIGDYRLIFEPDVEAGKITLVAFADRGSIYVD